MALRPNHHAERERRERTESEDADEGQGVIIEESVADHSTVDVLCVGYQVLKYNVSVFKREVCKL